MKSFIAYVKSAKGSILLGGTNRVVSSRFETEKLAHKWVHQTIKANCEAHREIGSWGFEVLEKEPEILEKDTT